MHLTMFDKRLIKPAQLLAVLALLAASVLPASAQNKQQDSKDQTIADLRQRVEQLEGQIVDMQVIIGTLQTLARSGGAGGASGAVADGYAGGASGASFGTSAQDKARIDGMETQIRALTAQIEQLSRNANRGAVNETYQGYSYNNSTQLSDAQGQTGAADGFGSTTITQELAGGPGQKQRGAGAGGDPIGGIIANDYGAGSAANGNANTRQAYAAPQAGRDAGQAPAQRETVGGNPKALYETAYGYLLQQDYGAAEVAFQDFLQRYPSNKLAGNAQYWLGEAHYVRGQYKSAAGAFLRGYQTYAKSSKAPDSLLKLAMSLQRLGQTDAACSSYNELLKRFPKAPVHVKNRAASERRRVGC